MSKPSPKRPMTVEEIEATKLLAGVTYPIASWDKRFGGHLQWAIQQEPPMISERAVAQLWRMVLRYRRQLPTQIRVKYVHIAEGLAAPDLRSKQYRVEREYQARIDQMKREAAMQASNPAPPSEPPPTDKNQPTLI